MDIKTFKNLLNSYKDIKKCISVLNEELDALWYEATGVKGVRYDKKKMATNPLVIDERKLELFEHINEVTAERDMYQSIVDVLEKKLSKLNAKDKEIILKILVENSTNEQVGREVGYTKSGIWYKVMQDIKRIL